MQNPKWWGTPANAKSIVVHLASSTAQLGQWMASGYVQVAAPTTVTQSFLTQMTGLPGAQSEVDTSANLLQLDMASSLDSDLSPDLRAAIALSINRQDLVNQQVSWASPRHCAGQQPPRRAGPAELQAALDRLADDDRAAADLVDVDDGDRRRAAA